MSFKIVTEKSITKRMQPAEKDDWLSSGGSGKAEGQAAVFNSYHEKKFELFPLGIGLTY